MTRALKGLRKRKWRLEGKQKKKIWDDAGKNQGVAETSILRKRRRGHLHL